MTKLGGYLLAMKINSGQNVKRSLHGKTLFTANKLSASAPKSNLISFMKTMTSECSKAFCHFKRFHIIATILPSKEIGTSVIYYNYISINSLFYCPLKNLLYWLFVFFIIHSAKIHKLEGTYRKFQLLSSFLFCTFNTNRSTLPWTLL